MSTRSEQPWWRGIVDAWADPAFSWGMVIALVFVVLAGSLAAWTRDQPLVAQGRIAGETRIVRRTFTDENKAQTELAKERAEQATPRVFRPIPGVIEDLASRVRAMPARAAAMPQEEDTPADPLAPETVLREIGADEARSAAWTRACDELADILTRNPVLTEADFRRVTEGLDPRIELVLDDQSEMPSRDQAISLADAASVRVRFERLVGNAGFSGVEATAVLAALTDDPVATFSPDESLNLERQQQARESIQPVVDTWARGQVIFARGDRLTAAQVELFRKELLKHRTHEQTAAWTNPLRWAAAFGGVLAIALVAGAYVTLFVRRIARRPSRAAWIAGTMLLAQAIASVGTAADPSFIMLAAAGPVVLVAMLFAIAYDQRTAMALGALTAVLVAISLRLPIGPLTVLLLGVGVAVWRLRELRDRRGLVGVSVATAVCLAAATPVIGQLSMPVTGNAQRQLLGDAALAGVAGLFAGGVTQFILPLIERIFSITTGMTLIELRDPKQPLLRDLQRRAPGTYNHSLNVASIAENASDAIGADGLLTYVGALYHDVGKMNKPEYFVENQPRGFNKHDRLSPAMSLLVIIGHVKDGMAIAAEHGLPRELRHFIEGHHGTTLVEYFYRRAIEQACQVDADGDGEPDEERLPDEFDFRYPGPKPHTKEVAILMLADAVESATRAMAEPTPSRIDALVRELADKRLADGQFDQCDLTLRELHIIVESISKTVASIYHGRIHYPGTEKSEKKPEEQLLAIVEEFNATNEYGITVEARNEGGYGDIYNKMIAGLTSGELPGLVVAYQNQAAAYQVADGLVSLEPYIEHPVYGLSDDDLGDFFASFINQDRLPQFGGQSFGFPPNRSLEVMYYNATWLAELADAGAVSFDGPPQTPEQFAEAVCAAAANPFSQNPDPSFSVGYEVRTDASNVAALAFSRGVDIYDYDANQFTYNQPEIAEALTAMATLLADGCAGEIAERFGDQTDFGAGKTLFTMGSTSGLPFYKSAVDEGDAGGFEWSVAPIPYTTAEPTLNIYGASVSVPKTDPQTQLAAWLFLKYYTSTDVQAAWARASNYFPVRESVAAGLPDYFEENPAYETAFSLLQYAKAEPGVAGYDPIRDAAAEAFIRVLAGEDAATVLAELDVTANQLLEEAAP